VIGKGFATDSKHHSFAEWPSMLVLAATTDLRKKLKLKHNYNFQLYTLMTRAL